MPVDPCAERPKCSDSADHFGQNPNELFAFASGDVVEVAALFLDSELVKQA